MGQAGTLRRLQWLIDASASKVEVCDRIGREHLAGEVLGIRGDSVLGALIDQTGGLVVADGYIKHLGGDNAYGDSLRQVNGLDYAEREGDGKEAAGVPVPSSLGVLVVAVDVLGGMFAIPSNATDAAQATVRYLPYDSMLWEDFRIGHADFVAWSLTGDARTLYPDDPVTGNLSSGRMLRCSPPLWMPVRAGEHRAMSVVPVAQVVRERIGMSRAMGDAVTPEGSMHA